MSKRKTITQAFHVTSEDMTFEDQDGIKTFVEDEIQSEKSESISTSRFGRAKKVKAIYDPSEHNGPVHKRKKEALALEAEKAQKTVTKTPTKKQMPVLVAAKRPVPDSTELVTKSPKVKPIVPKKTPADVAKRLSMEDIPKPVTKQRKLSIVPTVPLVKEPSKRIQQRKLLKTDESDEIPEIKRKQRSRSQSVAIGTSSVISSSTYEETSTISNGDIPDVRHWSHIQVSDYFNNSLKFSKTDSAIFTDEEIDGETLLIMKRSDIVNTKFQNLKLGTALKMWSQIIKFQTGSSDISQAWK